MKVIGIDPDSTRYGVAVYDDGLLSELLSLNIVKMVDFIESNSGLYVMENVLINKFIYSRNNNSNQAIAGRIAQNVGMCKQSQQHLMLFLEFYDRDFLLEKPTRSNWAKNKSVFEKATKWKGRSNEDTRSAAYFGYLHK